MGTYALECIAADYHAQADDKEYEQEFNHVGDYLDSIRVSKNSCRVQITTMAISMMIFK